MIKKQLFLGGAILLFAPFIVFNSCTKAQVQEPFVDPNCSDTISFNTQIAPMIQTYCISCHDTGNSTGYTLTNHTNISTNASDMLNAMKGQGAKKPSST